MDPLIFDVVCGDAATDWLDSKSNSDSWDSLYQSCRWKTPFLSRGFFKLWAKHYGDKWAPALVLGKDSGGTLCGLMPLATRAKFVTGTGAHQAEYQGWISSNRDAERFLIGALDAIRNTFPDHHVRLRYLSATIPVEALLSLCQQNPRALLTQRTRPLLKLDSEAIEKALRKRNNKSKLNRLTRKGKLAFKKVNRLEELIPRIDQIIAMYDLRQGAVNNVSPFLDDPKKKAFFLDWVNSQSDQLHVTCTDVDSRTISAFIGVNSETETSLAVLAHSPEYARHSPGKLHLYETALDLTKEGKQWLDLTPGDDPWKERFATDHDSVWELNCFTRPADALRVKLAQKWERVIRSLLLKVRISPATLRAVLAPLRRPDIMVLSRLWKSMAPVRNHSRVFCMDIEEYTCANEPGEARINALADLLCYDPSEGQPARQEFLCQAVDRLEAGEKAYTVTAHGKLVQCVWVNENPEEIFLPEVNQVFRCPKPSAVLHDALPTQKNCSLMQPHSTIRQIITDLKYNSGAKLAYILTDIDDPATDRFLENLGFRHYRSFYGFRFLWHHRYRQEVPLEAL